MAIKINKGLEKVTGGATKADMLSGSTDSTQQNISPLPTRPSPGASLAQTSAQGSLQQTPTLASTPTKTPATDPSALSTSNKMLK